MRSIFASALLSVLVAVPTIASAEGAGVFQHCRFDGHFVPLTEGRYTLAQLQSLGIQNDDLSSVLVVPGWKIRLWEHDNFQGRNLTLDGESECLVDLNFNDVASSVEVIRAGAQTTPAPTPQTAQAPVSGSAPPRLQELLDAHNSYRAKHGAPNLSWSASLAQGAQDWADRCEFRHTPQSERASAGENLSLWTGSRPVSAAVKLWYDEVSAYNHQSPGFSAQTGHFTQVVWNGSRELGCGASSCPGLGEFVVCRYLPAGNLRGAFPENVSPAK